MIIVKDVQFKKQFDIVILDILKLKFGTNGSIQTKNIYVNI